MNTNTRGEDEFLNFFKQYNIKDYLLYYELISKDNSFITKEEFGAEKNVETNASKLFLLLQICYLLHFSQMECYKETTLSTPNFKIMLTKEPESFYLNSTQPNYDYILLNPDLKLTITTNRYFIEHGKK